MKKTILILLSFSLLISIISCDINNENNNSDINTTNLQTTSYATTAPNTTTSDTTDTSTPNTTVPSSTDTSTPCTHIFGEWSTSKEATEAEDGEEIRVCSDCGHSETKPVHAKGTEGLSFILSEDEKAYSVNAGSATTGDVFIPAYHNGLPVTSIGYTDMDDEAEPETFAPGEYAFMNCTELKNIVVPPTITVIGDGAFAGCESLESILISPSVTVIGDGAFMLCKSLESIVIPESVKEIGEYAFALTEVEFPLSYYNSDIKVSIPNTQVILILREFSSFFSWGVEIYHLDENGCEILIEKIEFDNSSHVPFSNGDFEIINNNDNTFSVRAGDSEDKGKWIDQAFDIPQCVSVFVPKPEDTVTVFYSGNDSEEWDAIDIAEGNVRLTKDNITVKKCVIYYYSETEPSESNKYWHYVDGVPTLW